MQIHVASTTLGDRVFKHFKVFLDQHGLGAVVIDVHSIGYPSLHGLPEIMIVVPITGRDPAPALEIFGITDAFLGMSCELPVFSIPLAGNFGIAGTAAHVAGVAHLEVEDLGLIFALGHGQGHAVEPFTPALFARMFVVPAGLTVGVLPALFQRLLYLPARGAGPGILQGVRVQVDLLALLVFQVLPAVAAEIGAPRVMETQSLVRYHAIELAFVHTVI